MTKTQAIQILYELAEKNVLPPHIINGDADLQRIANEQIQALQIVGGLLPTGTKDDYTKMSKHFANLCQGGKHDLVVIFSASNWDGSETVVRWCNNCGSIVVDTDYDRRTQPCNVVHMQLPKLVQDIKDDYEPRK